MARDGHLGIDDLLHAPAYHVNVLQLNWMTDGEVDVVAIAHGDVDDHVAAAVDVVHSLAKNEKQGAGVVARTRLCGHVEKLHILVVVDTVVHAFHLIVYLSADGTVIHFHVQSVKNFRKCASGHDVQRFFIIFATDL